VNRRAFLLAVAPAAGCRHLPAAGFDVFVANEDGRSVAAVDLTTFSMRKEISIDGNPTAIISHGQRAAIYVLTPLTGTVHEIDPAALVVRRKARVAPSAVSMRLAGDGKSLWVLSRESRALVQLDLNTLRTGARIRLPAVPEDFDLTSEYAAISFPAEGAFAVARLSSARIEHMISGGHKARIIRFHADGRQMICGNGDDRTVTIFNLVKGRVVTHLPVAVEPENFCFKADNGGELYVTGAGMDAVVVIYPYQGYVYETRRVGRSPGAMALSSSPDYLLVANTESGDVTVMDIVTGKVITVVSVGAQPRYIAVTPDDRYAIVLNSRSGDMAVIRIAALSTPARKKSSPPPLFTMIPVGVKPVCAAVRGA
jgi:YVTN family beta-propeller protein